MPKEFNATVARNVKFFRSERGLSEDELVERCDGISKSLLNNIENSRHKKFVGSEHIKQIAKGLNVSPEAITSSNTKLNEKLATLEKQINRMQINTETECELSQLLLDCSKYGPIEQTKALLICGMFDFSKGKYESAKKFFSVAAEMADISPRHPVLYQARQDLGSVYLMIGEYDEALRIAKQNLLEVDDLDQKAMNLFLVGSVYNKNRKWDESEKAFLEVIELFEKGTITHEMLVGRCHQMLGDIYKNTGQYKKSLDASIKAIFHSNNTNDIMCSIYATKTQGEVYLEKNDRPKALEKFIETSEMAKGIGWHREIEVLKIEFCIASCRFEYEQTCLLLEKIEEQEMAPVEISKLYRETARLADLVGRHNDASRYYEKALQKISV